MTDHDFHFLVLHNVVDCSAVVVERFADTDTAHVAFVGIEHKYFGDADFQVVLLGSDSEETIRSTHANLFARPKLSIEFEVIAALNAKPVLGD